MPTPLPSPLAAAIGVVPAVLDGVRRLPGRAVQLPVLAISSALNTMDLVRREYDDLADRGEALVSRLRGDAAREAEQAAAAVDRAADEVADAAARLAERADRTLDRTAATAREAARTVADSTRHAAGAAADALEHTASTVETAAGTVEQVAVADAVDKDGAAPRGLVRHDTAASPEVQRTVAEAVQQVTNGAAVEVLDHAELPVPDYDHMTLGSLRGRLRALTVDQLAQIRAYEKAHADRLPVVTMLDNRIAKLATDRSAAPSGPVSTEPAPEQRASAAAAGAGTSSATSTAPVIDPRSQGNPTTPGR